MIAVDIDVSKGKSAVLSIDQATWCLWHLVMFPTQSSLSALIEQIKSLDGEVKVCMEHTGRYYEPVANWLSNAGLFVSAVNPVLLKEFSDGSSLRQPKTDKADSKKLLVLLLPIGTICRNMVLWIVNVNNSKL